MTRVLQVCIAGIGWERLEPLIAHGLMPTLASLRTTGVSGQLLAAPPQVPVHMDHTLLSGYAADAHGLLHPLLSQDGALRARTDADARQPSLIDRLAAAQIPALWVGWPHIQPRCDAHCVSVPRLLVADDGYDDRYDVPLGQLRVAASDLAMAHLKPFHVETDEASIAADPSTPALRAALAEAASLQAVMTWLLQRRNWRMASLRVGLADRVGMLFGDCHPPLSEDADPQRVLRYQYMITGALRFVDLLLARLRSLVGEDCVICVHSDQGAPLARSNPGDAAVHLRHRASHHRRGFVLFQGPGIVPSGKLWAADQVDLAPTLLRVLRLQQADLPGRMMAEAFVDQAELSPLPGDVALPLLDPEFATALLAERLAHAEVPPPESLDAEQLSDESELLGALGLLQSGAAEAALVRLVALSEKRPDWRRCVLHRARCHLAVGDDAEAQRWIARFLELGEADLRSHLLLGQIFLRRKQHQQALIHFLQAEQQQPDDPTSHCQIADAYRQAGRADAAAEAFARALKLDPGCAEAHLGLAKLALQDDRNDEAISRCLQGMEDHYRLPELHFHLGVALARSGQLRESIAAFELSLSLAPKLKAAHQWLAKLYRLVEGGMERAVQHQLMGQESEVPGNRA